MNCPNCLSAYDCGARVPLILIGCGHTLCQNCVRLLFDASQKSLTCTECFTPSVGHDPQHFPKNLALMTAASPAPTKARSASPAAQLPLKRVARAPLPPVATLCSEHSKKIEAFCLSDKSLLCIDCILANLHRSHKIESITNAFDVEREALYTSYTGALELQEHLRALVRDIESHSALLAERAAHKRAEVTAIFNEIRKVVHERESSLKQSFAELLIREEAELGHHRKVLENHLDAILRLREEVQGKVDQESNLQFLGHAGARTELARLATAKVEPVNFRNIFTEIRRDQQVAALFRLLNPKKPASSSVAQYPYKERRAGARQKGSSSSVQSANTSGFKAIVPKRDLKGSKMSLVGAAVRDANSPRAMSKPIQRKPGVNTSLHKLPLRKLNTDIDSSELEKNIQEIGVQSNKGTDRHFAFSPNKSRGSEAAMTSRKNSEKSLDIEGPRRKKQPQVYPTRSSVILSFKPHVGGDESPLEQLSTHNLYKLMQSKSETESASTISALQDAPVESRDNSFNRVLDDMRQTQTRGGGERVSSVERMRWTKKSNNALNEARAKAKKAANLSLQASGEDFKLRRSMVESTFKKQRYSSLEPQEGARPAGRFFTEASKKGGGANVSEEEECQVGSQGKPNNSKISPDTKKRQQFEPPDSPTFKLSRSLRKSVIEDGPDHAIQLRQKLLHVQQAETDQERKLPSPSQSFASRSVLEQAIKTLEISNSSMLSPTLMSPSGKSRDDLHSILKNFNQKNNLLVISGYGSAKIVNQKYALGKDYWTEMTGLNVNRSKFGAVALPGGSVMVLGGKKNEGKNVSRNRFITQLRLKSIQEFNPLDGRWTTSSLTLPEARSGMGCVIDPDGRLYICGGNANGHITNSCLAIDVVGNSQHWLQVPSMLWRRDEFALTLGPDHKLYAIGGFGGAERAPLRECERFDPATGQWEAIAPLNEARRALTAVCLPDGIYAIGGFDRRKSLATVEKFDIYKNKWSYVGSMKQARCTHSAVASLSAIYVIGGFDEGPLAMVEKYDALSDEWEIMAPLNRSRFMHQSVLF